MSFLKIQGLGSKLAPGVGFLLLWMYASAICCLVEWVCLGLLLYTLYDLYKANVRGDAQGYQLDVVKERDVVLITGCDKGLGEAAAHKLSEKFTVIATVLDTTTPAAVALRNKGVDVVQLELTNSDSVAALVAHVEGALTDDKRLHGLINNAGTCLMGELDWFSPEQLDRVLTVNLTGPVFLTKLLLPSIIEHKTRIVNVTGVKGTIPVTGMAAYCAGKYGLEGFGDALRLELDKYGVKIITVRPGDYSALEPLIEHDQVQCTNVMWNNMTPQKKTLYAQRFKAFFRMLTTNRGRLSASDYDGIRTVFEDTMISKEPPEEYNEGELLFIVAYTFLSMLPRRISGKILNFLNERDVRKYLFL